MKKYFILTLVLGVTVFSALALASYGKNFRPYKAHASYEVGQMNAPQYAYSGHLQSKDANTIAAIRQAGIQGDQSKIPMIIEAVKKPAHKTYVYTCLHSLAQLGAIEALSTIDSMVQTIQDQDIRNFAKVTRARVLAEDSAKFIVDNKAKASVKVKSIYKELAMTPATLNAALLAFHAPKVDEQGRTYISVGGKDIHPIELYVMRELADLIYGGGYKNFADLPEVNQVDFQQDYASALKVRLAPLSRKDRIITIIQELSHKTALTFSDYNEIQLAINEGPIASQVAASELKKMEMHRDQYNQINHHSGFTALFQVIAGVGDEQQAPLVDHFKQDHDPAVRHYADVLYDDIAAGVKREAVPAY